MTASTGTFYLVEAINPAAAYTADLLGAQATADELAAAINNATRQGCTVEINGTPIARGAAPASACKNGSLAYTETNRSGHGTHRAWAKAYRPLTINITK